MAIDKSRTSPLMKTLILALAGTFVVGIGFAGLSSISSCTPNAPLLPNGSSTTAATNTTATLTAIDLRNAPAIKAREASITAEPKNYTLLLAQANGYYDWASQILQTTKQQTTSDLTLWKQAVTYYERALAVKPGDPNVETDFSIALFYSGDVTGAVAQGEKTQKANPTFAPIVFNLGIFYANSSAPDAKAKATAQFDAYLKLEPNGSNAANAKQFLKDLAAAPSTPATGSAPTTP